MDRIGFIGAGNMAEAIIRALIQSSCFDPGEIQITDIAPARCAKLSRELAVITAPSNTDLFAACPVVILAVKPQQIDAVLADLAKHSVAEPATRKLIISIAAGVPLGRIETYLYDALSETRQHWRPIIRVMPNTPALVLSGMTGLCPNRFCSPSDVACATAIFSATGKVLQFAEAEMDAVTALSGSGPAYLFYLIEAMTAAGVKLGLDEQRAALLSVTTAVGALKMLAETQETPEALRRMVTSPGGTTEAAFTVLTQNQVKEHIMAAIQAAAARAAELCRA